MLGHMEFARTTSVEYAQVLGAIANVLISLPPAGDAPIALDFLENLPILADSWASDNVLGAQFICRSGFYHSSCPKYLAHA